MSDTAKKNKSVRLSKEQLEALARHAARDRREVSEVIRIAIDEFIERQVESDSQREAVLA